jgi:hypothetical protein
MDAALIKRNGKGVLVFKLASKPVFDDDALKRINSSPMLMHLFATKTSAGVELDYDTADMLDLTGFLVRSSHDITTACLIVRDVCLTAASCEAGEIPVAVSFNPDHAYWNPENEELRMTCFPFDCNINVRESARQLLALVFGALFVLESDADGSKLNRLMNLYKRDFDPVVLARTAEDIIAEENTSGSKRIISAIAQRLDRIRKRGGASTAAEEVDDLPDKASSTPSPLKRALLGATPKIQLHVVSDLEDSVYEIEGYPCVLGRSDKADVSINDPGMSRIHATLDIRDGEPIIVDNNSANGVVINEERLKAGGSKKVGRGDVILLGSTVVTVSEIN